MADPAGTIAATGLGGAHAFSKAPRPAIELVAGAGVAGDAHAGATVKHRSRVARDPTAPNLRQVHLMPAEILEALAERGFDVAPCALGENVTTRGLDLHALPRGTRLAFGAGAVVELTGLRNPCKQLDAYQDGLMRAVLDRDATGALLRRAGVMGIVHTGGPVRPGDTIAVTRPAGPPVPLAPV